MKKQSQNKPNLMDAQMNISSVLTKDYKNVRLCRRGENKPNQTQSPRPRFYPKKQPYPRKNMPKKPYFPLNYDNFSPLFFQFCTIDVKFLPAHLNIKLAFNLTR